MNKATTITREALRRRAGFFNIGEAAVLIGIEPRRFRYKLECGVVAKPSIRIGGGARRYYSREELERLQRLLAQGK
jgi:DNA-binding transcriptional MerR regulator